MLRYQFRPLTQWPGERTRNRRASPFKSRYAATLDLLQYEIELLKGREIVVQADVDESHIRNDGMLRGDARLKSPAIILSFESRLGPLSYPCDAFTDWQSNLRAIALSLEALRKIDRYGVTRRAEQYRGWQALPAPGDNLFPDKNAALQFLYRWAGRADLPSDELIRICEKRTHPDAGGNAEDFKMVQAARRLLTEK